MQSIYLSPEQAIPGISYHKAIAAFFGNQPVDVFWPNAPLDVQVMSAIAQSDGTSPKFPAKTDLGDGMILVTGCRYNYCYSKAALVFSRSGSIIAGATLGKCHGIYKKETMVASRCGDLPILSIFRRQKNPLPRNIDSEFLKWAEVKLKEQFTSLIYTGFKNEPPKVVQIDLSK